MNPESSSAPATVLQALARHRIWSQLEPAVLATLAPQWEQTEANVGTSLRPQGQLHNRTGLILDGMVDLHDPDLDIAVHLQPGDMFGFGATPEQHLSTWQATAASDCRIAWLDAETVAALCREHLILASHSFAEHILFHMNGSLSQLRFAGHDVLQRIERMQ